MINRWGTETLSYTGTRRRDGSQYGPTVEKPTEAGSYKVSVRCETEETIYSGSADFTIAPENIGSGTVTLGNALTYNGSQQTQAVAGLMLDGYDILPDCTVSSNTGTGAGDYTLTVTANENSNYTGTIQQVFTIAKKAVTPVITVSGTYTFTGKAVIPDFTVNNGEMPLAETDFTAVISDNINAGTAKVTVSAADAGNYSFEPQDLTFQIAKAQVTYADVESTVIYTASSKTVTLTCVPADAGKFEIIPAAAAQTTGSVVFDGADADADAKTVLIRFSNGAEGDSITLPVTITTENYEDADLNIILTLGRRDETKVSIREGDSLTVIEGKSLTLHASADEEGPNGKWTWKSSDESVAVVDENGIVTILKPGVTKITAEYESDTTVGSAVIQLTVEPKLFIVLIKTEGQGSAAAFTGSGKESSRVSGAAGTVVTLKADPEEGWKFSEWKVSPQKAGKLNGNSYTIGRDDVTITAVFEKEEEEKEEKTLVTLKFEHYQQDGTPGVPQDIPDDLTLSLTLKANKDGQDIEASAVMDTIEPGNRRSQASFSFDGILDFADGYEFTQNFAPKTVTGKPVYGNPPIPGNTYTLTVTSIAPAEGKKSEGYCLKIMMLWDDGTRYNPDDDIAIYALPEDEIGAYVQYQDGTKEYLLFHTYDICMDWLGSDELCSGYDRCFHKENPYQNPFVK